jgi:uncharacterized RDD family membrane protein YckC
MNWHYVEQGQQIGPVTEEQLSQLFQAGTINDETLVWRAGLAEWQPYGQVWPKPGPEQTAETQAATENTLNGNEVVCVECGKLFPTGETIRHGNAHVCAACKPVFLQKLAEGAKVQTGEMDYAGFGIRFGAKFLDGLILGIPFMVVLFAAMMPMIQADMHKNGNRSNPPEAIQFLPMLLQFGFIFIKLAYETFFLGKYGATPGKMICKIKVVTAEGGRFGYGRAAGRCLAEMLSGMICYIGYLMVLFDSKEKRALHDHICNTRVIYK